MSSSSSTFYLMEYIGEIRMGQNRRLVYYFRILVWFFSLNNLVFSKDLPAALRNLKCPLTDEFDDCFLVNGNKAIPIITKGDPEYGIPNMTPLEFPFISLISTPTLQVNLTNVEVHGLDKMIITGHQTDSERGLFISYLKGRNITIVGDYVANGRISIIALRGTGKFSMYLKNGRYMSENKIEVYEKDCEKYFKPVYNNFNAKFERIIFYLENLFEGNVMLGLQANAFLNDNWEDLVLEFGPRIGKLISNIDFGMFESLAAQVPLKNLYL